MEKIAFIKAGELKGCELKGIVEVKISTVEFGDDKYHANCGVIIPDGRGYYVDLSCLFVDKGLERAYDADCFYVEGFGACNGRCGATQIDGIGVYGVGRLVAWSEDDDECIISVGGHKIQYGKMGAWYESKAEFIKCEPVALHKQDGTVEAIGGEYRKYALTLEQEGIVHELEDILERAREAKIRFGYNYESDFMIAVSDPDGDIRIDEYLDQEIPDRFLRKVSEKVICGITDYYKFVKDED